MDKILNEISFQAIFLFSLCICSFCSFTQYKIVQSVFCVEVGNQPVLSNLRMLISVKQIAKPNFEFLTKYILTSLTVLNIICCISKAFMCRGLKLDFLA